MLVVTHSDVPELSPPTLNQVLGGQCHPYGFRYAVWDLPVRSPRGEPEVEGAHVYPRSRSDSGDPRNGITLCKRHHWCFDQGISSIADDYTIIALGDLPNTPDNDRIRTLSGQFPICPSNLQFAPHPIFLKARRELMGRE
jgi:HNH endonuclease